MSDDARAASADRILFLANGEVVMELHAADEHELLTTSKEITA